MFQQSRCVTCAVRLSLAALAFVPALAPLDAQAQTAQRSYDIPAGPLSSALARFAAESGLLLSADAQLTEGKKTAGLKGAYSTDAGLKVLLAGSGLEFVRSGTGVTLRRTVPSTQSEQQMQEVKVSAAQDRAALPTPFAGGQVARGVSLGLLGNTDYMDTPFSVSSVTEKSIRDEQTRELADVFRFDASAQKIGGLSTPAIVFRGFNLGTAETGYNGHYGLGNLNGYTDVQAAERVEIIRGPTALLQGYVGGSTGASINVVTKRATDQPLARLSTFWETGSNSGAAVDVGRRFGATGEWGIRFNGLYRDGKVGDEEQNHKNEMGSLALDFRGERLRASFDYIRHDQKGRGLYGCINNDLNLPPDQTKCFLPTYEHMDIRNTVIIAAIEYDITDRLRVSLSHGRNDADAYFGATFASWMTPPAGGLQPLMVQSFPLFTRPRSNQANLHWDFDSGPVKHETTFGVSQYKSKAYIAYDAFENGVSIPEGTSPPDLAPPNPGMPALSEGSKHRSYAVVDRMSFDGGRYQVIAGLRRQNVVTDVVGQETIDTSATTPSLALIYKPVDRWMGYGSYIEGLKPGQRAPFEGPLGPGSFYVNGGQMFAPTQNKQYEGGVKYDGGKLGATLGVFQMTELNARSIATADPAAFIFAIDGERRHRGVEANVFGEPVRGVRVLGSLTVMDAKLTKTQDGLQDGEEVIGVPRQKFVVNGEYDIPGLPGLTLSGTMTAVSDANRDIGNPALGDRLPGYTIFDAGVRYRTSVVGRATTLRLNLRNLFDKQYYSAASPDGGWLTFGQPRMVFLSAEIEM